MFALVVWHDQVRGKISRARALATSRRKRNVLRHVLENGV